MTLNGFGDRQRDLLKMLLKKKQGVTVDEVSAALGITRPATRQHLAALDRLGYIERGKLTVTGGRPGQTFRLSVKGFELFPKQYSWFSEILLESLSAQLGGAGLRKFMRQLGSDIARQVGDQVRGETLKEKVEQTAELMNDLAFEAEAVFTGTEMPGAPPVIEASNCVYHALAAKFPEMCQFDISLLSSLTGAEVIHEKCIRSGGGICRFRFRPKKRTASE